MMRGDRQTFEEQWKQMELEAQVKAGRDFLEEYNSLITSLVGIVDAILASHPSNIWHVYGGFSRVYNAVCHILYHGYKIRNDKGEADLWPFIAGLHTISPELGPAPEVSSLNKRAELWLKTSLQSHFLSLRIAALASNRDHLENHYECWSFLAQPPYRQAFFTCLQALEQNSQTVLADIDPKLLLQSFKTIPGSQSILEAQYTNYSPTVHTTMSQDAQTRTIFNKGFKSLPTSPMIIRKECESERSPLWIKKYEELSEEDILHTVRESPDGSSDVTQVTPVSEQLRRNSKACLKSRDSSSQTSQHFPSTIAQLVTRMAAVDVKPCDGARPKLKTCTSHHPQYQRFNSKGMTAKMTMKSILSPSLSDSELLPGKEYYQKAVSKTDVTVPDDEVMFEVSDEASKISPSLIKVDYNVDKSTAFSPSDSDHSSGTLKSVESAFSSGSGKPILRVKAPVMKRRSSSRLKPFVDSDNEESNERMKKRENQAVRRKRVIEKQEADPKCLKDIVDSRGILARGKSLESKNDVTSCRQKECSQAHIKGSCSSGRRPSNEIEQKEERANDQVDGASLSTPKPLDLGDGGQVPDHSRTKPRFRKTRSLSRSDEAQVALKGGVIAPFMLSSSTSNLPNLGSGYTQGSTKKSFMEDGGHSVIPAADGFFPRPQLGQSLIGFLSSKEFQKTPAELDRENAHFSISEAVIAAIEKMQFETWCSQNIDDGTEDSDEEIRNLQEQIREKRRQKYRSSKDATSCTSFSSKQQNSFKAESTTDNSVIESVYSSDDYSDSEILSETEEDSLNQSPENQTSERDGTENVNSAESIALNLLKSFNEQKLPKASDLDWLVSEQEVPQKLLPLPNSVAISPDDTHPEGVCSPASTHLRGTQNWAPPRPQIILTVPVKRSRKEMLRSQNWKCAGCGMEVPVNLSKYFRYCNYLGRYFCTTCHVNRTAVIPAQVIHNWDFKEYPVSTFSLQLLDTMFEDPLYNVWDINKKLYKRQKLLQQVHIYRSQLYQVRNYVRHCKMAKGLCENLDRAPKHWMNDPCIYSLSDLIYVRSGQMGEQIKNMTMDCLHHVDECMLCRGQGFICEVCKKNEVIFPFQLDKVMQCMHCNACFHMGCFLPNCPKCIRIQTRQRTLQSLHSPPTPQ